MKIRPLSLKLFSLIGGKYCSYKSVGNISTYLNAKNCLKRNKVALASFPVA